MEQGCGCLAIFLPIMVITMIDVAMSKLNTLSGLFRHPGKSGYERM